MAAHIELGHDSSLIQVMAFFLVKVVTKLLPESSLKEISHNTLGSELKSN